MNPIFIMRRHTGKILLMAVIAVLVVAALGMGFNPFYWRHPFDNSSPSVVLTSQGRPLLRPTIADLPYADQSPFEKLGLYLPARKSGPLPLVIWIHGGGMTVGDKLSIPRRDFGPPP